MLQVRRSKRQAGVDTDEEIVMAESDNEGGGPCNGRAAAGAGVFGQPHAAAHQLPQWLVRDLGLACGRPIFASRGTWTLNS